jgi:hypothetical protein
MAWLKLEDSAPNHPKVLRLGRVSGLSRDEAFGRLCRLWCWVLRYAVDGDLSGIERGDIEDACGLKIDHLIECELMDEGEKLSVHDWLERAGSYAEKMKKQKQRNKKKQEESLACPVTVPGQSTTRIEVDQIRSETEKTKKPRAAKSSPEADDVADYYRERFPDKGGVIKPGNVNYKRILDRLKEGWSVEDLFLSVEGLRADKWHRENKKFTADFAFRNSDKVDQLKDAAKQAREQPRRKPRGQDDVQSS